jgi:hypothetical protein
MYGAECGRHDEGSQRRPAVVKLSSIHPASETALDVLYGDTGLLPPGVLIDAASCVGSTDTVLWRLADGPGSGVLILKLRG